MSMSEAAAPIGDNISKLPLQERLKIDHDALAVRQKELLEAFGRAPGEVRDDGVLSKFGTLVVQMREVIKKSDRAHDDEKAPFLRDGRIVDQHFATISDPLKKAAATLESRAGIYSRAKADAERRRLAEEAARLQAEADERAEKARKAEEAGRIKTAEKQTAHAAELADQAQTAQKASEAKPADLARTRGDVALSTLKTTWDYEVEDWGQIDVRELSVYLSEEVLDKAIKAHIRIHKDRKPLTGVRIFEKSSQQFR